MVPSWLEIQKQPWFSSLTPEQKAQSLDQWTQDMQAEIGQDTEQLDLLGASSELEKKRIFGEEVPAFDQYIPEYKARKAADQQGFFSQMGGALKTGLSDVTTGLGVTFDKLTGDNEELAQGMAAMNETQRERQLNKTTRDVELEKALAENAKQFKEAKGFWPTTKELIDYAGIAVTNPVAMAKMALESAPNALISIGATTAGGILGAAGGPAGIAAGAAAGGAAANIPMEIPGAIHQSLMEATQGQAANWDAAKIKEFLDANPQVTEAGLKKGAIRGTAIGIVEGLTAGIAGKLATIPERAAEKAMLIHVGKQIGKDIATPTDVAAFLEAGKDLAKSQLAEIGQQTIEGYSLAQRAGLIVGAEAIETVGEGLGEYSAQKAAGEEVDPTAIFQEMAAGRFLGGASALGARLASLPQKIAQAGPEAQQAAGNLVQAQNLNEQAGQNPNATAAAAAAGAEINKASTEFINRVVPSIGSIVQPGAGVRAVVQSNQVRESLGEESDDEKTPTNFSPEKTQQALAQAPDGITAGYRITDLGKSDAYGKTGGWKLHLSVNPENYPAVDAWLHKNFKGEYKLLAGGSPEEGSDFTLYIGHKDEARAIADKIQGALGGVLNDFQEGKDTAFNQKVGGRFDVASGTRNAKDAPWQFAGAKGIPFDQFAYDDVYLAGESPKTREEFLQKSTPAIERIDKELAAKYGDFYTGTVTQPPQTTGSVPLMVTVDMRRQLADLGYSKAQINSMKPADAQDIIARGTTAPPKPKVEAPTPTNLPPTETAPQTPTPTSNAPIQRQVSENRVQERVQTDEGGKTAETGGGNRPPEGGQGTQEDVTLPPQGVVPTAPLPEGQPTPGGVGKPPSTPKSEAAKKGRVIARKALADAGKNMLGLPAAEDIIDQIESRIVLPARSGRKGKGEYDAINASNNPDKNKVFVTFPGKKVSPEAYTIDKAATALGYGTNIDSFVNDILQALENRRATKGREKTDEIRDKAAVAQIEAFNADKDLGQNSVNLDDLVPGSIVDVAGTKLTVDKVQYDEDGRTTSVSFKPSDRYGRVEVSPEDNLKSNEVINPAQESVSDFAPSEPTEEPAAKPAEELDLGATESKKPAVRGETKKPQAANPLAELQQAKAEGEAEQAQAKLPLTPKAKLEALDQEEANLLAKFRKSLGQTNVGFNPETFGIAVQLAGVAVRKGAVRFEQFAQYMKEVLPDLWDSIKDELASVWYRAAQDNEALEMPPGRQQIKDILDTLSQPPVAEEIVEEEEVPVVEPAPSPASPEALRTPIGFGSYENKTVEFLLANDPGYLFNTLFDANATVKADPTKLAAIREIVRQLPEYKRYLASQAKTKEQLAAERTVAVDTSIENLKNIAPEASVTVAESGAVQVKKPSDATKSLLKKFSFIYNNKTGAFETKDYAAVKEMGEYLAATDERKAMRDSPIEKKRVEIRAALDEADDESRNAIPFSSTRLPAVTPLSRSVMEFFQKGVRAAKISLQTAQNQLTDALAITLAKKNGKPMYLLGSQAGYGKTYVIASALAEMRERGAINENSRVIFFTLNKRLIKQAKKDMGNLYDGKIEFKTYSNLDNFTEEDFSPSDVLIFDEAHNIRYSVTGVPSPRAKKAEGMIDKAAFTLFSTATPYESVEQMRFLWPTGVFNELKGTFFPEDSEEKGWKDFAVAAGATPKGDLVTFNAQGQDAIADQTFAREFLRKKGMFSYRSSNIPEGMAESSLAGVEGDAEWASIAEAVVKAFEQFPLTPNDKGYVTNFLKRILEASKMGRAAELARKEMDEDPNKRVVIFTETKSQSIKSLADFSALAEAMRADPKMRIPEGFPQLPNVIKAFAYMHDVLGLQEINFPSVQDFFQKEFGAGNVVFYTGDESEDQRIKSQESWEKGEPRLMVATMAAGGTGLSLHDTSEGGKFPRVQISVNLPWRASELEQVSKRTARSGMTSKAKSYWLFANNLFNENKLASTVASRLSGLSFLVTGQSSSTAQSMANYEWKPLENEVEETPKSPLSEGMNAPITNEVASFFSADLPEGEPKGKVSKKDFEEGMKIVESLIRKARVVVIEDTRENLLKRDDIPEEVKITIRKGAQGAYSQGKAVVVRDGIQATSYTTSYAKAAAAVIFHEMLHYGMDVLRYDPKFADIYNQWRSLVRENVTPKMLDNLAMNPGYRHFAGWADSDKIRVRAEEEVFVRQMESLFRRKGNLAFREQNLLQRIKSWIGRMLERLFGEPIEGRLKDEILESWGKKIINAVQISNVMAEFDGGVSTSMNAQDAEYLAAVEAGDSGNDNLIQLLKSSPQNERKAVFEAWVKRNPEAAAKTQRMVNEAAKKAGFEVEAWHGSESFFNIFDPSKRKSPRLRGGLFFSTLSALADRYARDMRANPLVEKLQAEREDLIVRMVEEYSARGVSEDTVRTALLSDNKPEKSKASIELNRIAPSILSKYRDRIASIEDQLSIMDMVKGDIVTFGKLRESTYSEITRWYDELKENADDGEAWAQNKLSLLPPLPSFEDLSVETATRKFFLKARNPLVVDAGGRNWDTTILNSEQSFSEASAGYDSIRVNNVLDSPRLSDYGYGDEFAGFIEAPNTDLLSDVIVVGDPSQIKSADPVTYDDAGNVILLSQRFNPESPDIRLYAGEDTEGTNTQRRGKSRIATFAPEDAASVKEFMAGNDQFNKLKQFLGLLEGGEPGKVERLDPLKTAAKNEIGFQDDATGAPVVTPEATQKAKEIATQLLDPTSKFGAEYQSKHGVESAATAVLQMELLRYGLALAAKNDSSLLVALRSNWNGVMLGAYVSATSAGRVLNVRSHYVNQVMKTIDMMDKAQKTEATRKINELGVSEDGAETFVTSLQNVIKNLQYAQERREELLKAMLGNQKAGDFEKKGDPLFGWVDVALDEIGKDKKKLFSAILADLYNISQATKAMKEMEAEGGAEASIFDDVESGFDAGSLPKTADELRNFIAESKKRLNENLNKWFQSGQEEGEPVPGGEEAPEDKDVDEPEDENDGNEATEAAKKIIENLKAFLNKKFSTKKISPSVYTKIKEVVDRAIENPDEWDFSRFSLEATKELNALETAEGFKIDDKVLAELISRAYTVFLRFPQKTAEKLVSDLMKADKETESLVPEKAIELRKVVRKFVINKDRLSETAFIQKMTAEIQNLGAPIQAETVKKLVANAYAKSVARRSEQIQRKVQRIKEALLDGSRKTLVTELLKDKNADVNNPIWRVITLKRLLVNSGLSQTEAAEALRSFTQDDMDAIYRETEKKAIDEIAERTDKFVQNFIKQYQKKLAEPLDKKRSQAQESLRSLVRAQVKVPLPQDLFVAEAARFGATQEQALRLYNLARVEADLLTAEKGVSPTMLQKLVKHILSRPALANDPVARNLAIENFLRHNGYSDAMIASSKSWIQAAFEDFIKKAKIDALDKHVAELRKRAAKDNVPSTFGVVSDPFLLTGKAKQQLDKDLSMIRKGLGDFEIDPQQALAKELGYTGFRPEDYKSLGELDLKITRAIEDGRQHDVSLGLKELYELLSRRRAPKTLLKVLQISYINSALGGFGTIGVNFLSPSGPFINRVLFDMGRALIRGRFEEMFNIGKLAIDAIKRIPREAGFGLFSGASNVTMNNVVMEVTTLQGELDAAKKILLGPVKEGDKKPTALQKVKAAYTAAAAYTGIISRVLMTADHVWSSVLQNYFIRVRAMDALLSTGNLTAKEYMPMLSSILMQEKAFLDFNNMVIANFSQKADDLFNTGNATKEQLLQLVSEIEIAKGLSDENRVFIEDFKGDMRRVINAYLKPESMKKQLTKALKQASRNARLRMDDRMNKGIYLAIQKQVSPEQAEAVFKTSSNETEYEMGTHKGEDSPIWDVVNTFAQLIRDMGQSVKNKNPILGTMLLGFFGIPVNLLNRAMWYSPYGLIRYAIKKSIKVNSDQFYQQSMETQSQMRDRLIEAWVGTAAIGFALMLKSLDDDEDEGFNVTLAGPSAKTEQDAWRKRGHRQGSIEYVSKDGGIVSLNWARGLLEPWKIGMLAVGAVDDMRLNRKLGDKNLPTSFSDYFSAIAYGWSKQAAFFGAKNTVGAFLEVNPEANIAGNLLYKLNPFFPFSGTIKSMESMLVGPDRFRGRDGAVWLNLPIARSLATERAVNALGDPQGYVPTDAWSTLNDRAWYNGIPLMVSGAPTGSDKRIYDFILDRGTGPGIPQRSILENQNGIMPDRDWLDYVAARGRIVKSEMIRQMSRLERMDDEDLSKAFGEISSKATREAKRRFGYK